MRTAVALPACLLLSVSVWAQEGRADGNSAVAVTTTATAQAAAVGEEEEYDDIWGVTHPRAALEEDLPKVLLEYLDLFKSRGRLTAQACGEGYTVSCEDVALRCPSDPSSCTRAQFERIMLLVMGELVERMPDDRLATGQGVWVFLLLQRPGLAARTVEVCTESPGWCEMLRGILAFQDGRWDDARAAYRIAIAQTDRRDHCAFTDLEWILRDAGPYSKLPCEERGAANDSIWWLADPLWTVPENQRRLEHAHRVAVTILHNDYLELESIPGDVVNWGRHPRSHHFSTIRSSWARRAFEPIPLLELVDGIILSTTDDGSSEYQFVPGPEAIRDPFHAAATDWELVAERPLEVASHPHWPRFEPLGSQVGFFPRGDSSVIAAAAEPEFQSVLEGSDLSRAALIVSTGPDDLRIKWDESSRDRYVMFDTVATRRYLVGMEVLNNYVRVAGRARTGTGPPDGPDQRVRGSDLMLLRMDRISGDPTRVEEAADALLGRDWIFTTEPIGAFWELYGLEPDEVYEVSVQAKRHEGFFGRFARSIGLGDESSVVNWTEGAAPIDGVSGRAIALSVGGLEPGDYTFEITVTVEGQLPVTVSREIEVR